MHCRASPLSYTRSTKTICPKISVTLLLHFFIVTKRISDWHYFCKWEFLFFISQKVSFYGNYASDNACWIFAGFEVVLSVTGMLVDLSVAIMQVTVSVAIMQLEVSVAHMQVTVSAKNMWMTIFLQCIMHMTVSTNNFIFCSLTDSLSS